MDSKRLSELLEKHKAGTASESEIKEIEAFADSHSNPHPFTNEADRMRIHDELRQRIEIKDQSSFQWLRVAASVIVVLGAAIGLWFGLAKEEMLIAHTRAGETLTITLEDGTEVSLNSGSTLEYPASFDATYRDVTLNGEALFKVAKDKNRPFTVQSNGVSTQVLGTVFNVNAFAEDSLVLVSLVEGSVKVSGEAGDQILKPMQEATFNLVKNELSVGQFDPASAVAWLDGVVVFDRMSMDRLCRFIMRKYNVKVSLEDASMKDYTISGKFIQPSLEVLLASTTAAKGLDFKKVGESEYLIFQPE